MEDDEGADYTNLQDEIDDLQSNIDSHEYHDIYEELKELQGLKDELGSAFGDETMIPESDWVDYVEEMLKDCGELPKNIPHYIVIDWDATADNIAQDYQLVTYQGDEYYVLNV